MKDLLVYGCGSLGKIIDQIVFDINQQAPEWNLVGFIDDDSNTHGSEVAGNPVLGGVEILQKYPEACLIIGFANPEQKCETADKLKNNGFDNFATLIHPKSWLSRRVKIGEGSLIYPGVYIDVDVELGKHVILNKTCTVGHDTQAGDFMTAAPGVNLGGHNNIGRGVDFGINSASIQNVNIGDWSVIGGGAMVIRDVPPGRVYVGVPAKDIKPKS